MNRFILLFALLSFAAAAKDLGAKIHTELGVVELKLHVDAAPKTVGNFVSLARAGFYDGQIFHRVLPGFAVQTGDPTGRGGGGPGYCFPDEFGTGLVHDKAGVVTMVNTAPGSNGSQFMIMLAAAPVLDGRNPVFGEVTAGLDVAEKVVVGTKIEKIEIIGDAALTLPEKTPELTLAELKARASRSVEKVLTGLGQTLGLGVLKAFEVDAVRSRCAESQLTVSAEYEKKAGAKLLLYGKSEGADYRVEQLQWSR